MSHFCGIRVLALVALSAQVALTLGLSGCTSKSSMDPPNTLRLATSTKIKSLDPIYADDLYGAAEAARAYEGLLEYHYLKRPYVLVPNLAEAMPQISKDGKTLTFKIKKGVLFQDDASFKQTNGKGRELVAEDFVYSLKRLADPKLVSTGWWVLDGKVVGLNEWRDEAAKSGADYSKPVEGLKALDRYTLQITLKQRSAQFLYFLAMPFTYAVPREAVEAYGKDFLNHPVGTGPFKIQEYGGATAGRLVWVKNPTYRTELYPSEGEAGDKESGLLADAGQPLPRAEKLIVQVFEESQPMWLTFLSGKLDVAGIPKDNFQQAISSNKDLSPELKQKGIVLSTSPEADITHLSFNMADPLLGKNKYLRQALSTAFDEEQFIELFYNGRAIAAQGPIPPGVSGYDPDFKNPFRQFNVAKAKELLAKAGYPNGKGLPPLEYVTVSNSFSRQSTEYTQRMFDALGVKLKVNSYSWPEFQSAVKNRKGQIWSFAWGGDYPDGENFLQLFYSKNKSPGPNDSNYSNPEFDKLYEQALQMTDSPARTALYRKMVAIVTEDCPWIFNSHRIAFSLTQPWLKNYKRSSFGHGSAKYYRVDPALKK